MYFNYIVNTNLVSLFDIDNKFGFFPSVHRDTQFSLVSLGNSDYVDIAFSIVNLDQLNDKRRHFTLTKDEFSLINPNTKNCPIFKSEMDAIITKKVYKTIPVLINESKSGSVSNLWGIYFRQGLFNMTTASGLFSRDDSDSKLPLYEGKLIHQYDHRYESYNSDDKTVEILTHEKQNQQYKIKPMFWIDKLEVIKKIDNDVEMKNLKTRREWFFGFRAISNIANERTLISAIIPFSAVGNNLSLVFFQKNLKHELMLLLLSNFNSLILDFIIRLKMGSKNVNFFVVKQLPVLPPSAYSQDDLDFIVPRVLELTYTAVDLIPFVEDLWDSADSKMRWLFLEQRHGEKSAAFEEFTRYDTAHLSVDAKSLNKQVCLSDILPPFVFEPERRSLLRAALDARYARLYGLTRDDLRYILDPADLMGPDYPSETFRVLKEKEIAEFGEYRTRRLVLEAWDGEERKL